ncbi:alpha-galactosidase [Microbacterium foliorum]|uniref:alpha-galactosidase n=1 Tax=Microbacterium foliorum TaxID=104336 RepID=A0A0F0KW03_9MICO|nr:alpha-galactosidase [Microbacterium foliorum]AXL13466.1 alpha-galactosidase [Microbacterium foliorum]KJL25063.1 Alpha-galactosidase [Microbacterium foliorum]
MSALVHLTSAGVSVVVDTATARLLHWGAALHPADLDALAQTSTGSVTFSSFDAPRTLPLLAVEADGWSGAPALAWHRDGLHSAPLLRAGEWESTATSLRGRFADAGAAASVILDLDLDAAGVLTAQVTVTSTADPDAAPLDLLAARVLLPIPAHATEVLDHTGRWTGERSPQRGPLRHGAHLRQVRRGRGGHDAPYLTVLGTDGFGFRRGELWAAHVAWSGDLEVGVERLPEGAGVHGAVLGGGELLLPGEIRLGAGETYVSPRVYLAYGEAGLDSVSVRLHRTARALPGHPETPRPLVLNTWEAVYFDHDPAKIAALAEAAASVGVERFVLDDGWFRGRPDDRSGLGDWYIDDAKWPEGLRPLADHVHGLGMQFGLWFEPEMVNPVSELVAQHPDWVLQASPDSPTWRHQKVLDLANPGAAAHLLERLSALVAEVGVDFIKWDHNRDLHAAVSPHTGRASVHAQTTAFYALLDALRERHPALEIESCASGGARVDLGVLQRTQRVWASDSNDPVERQRIQRWTGTLVPPEVVGSHVGPAIAETTHRAASLPFRMTTALFGHAGIEWDITGCTPEERAALTRWTALYRELRPLLHAGITVRSDEVDDETLLHGVVAPDGSRGVFAWVRLGTSVDGFTPRTRVPGLQAGERYRLRMREDLGAVARHQVADPGWIDAGIEATGAFLETVGVPLPLLAPGSALLLEAVRVRASAVLD